MHDNNVIITYTARRRRRRRWCARLEVLSCSSRSAFGRTHAKTVDEYYHKHGEHITVFGRWPEKNINCCRVIIIIIIFIVPSLYHYYVSEFCAASVRYNVFITIIVKTINVVYFYPRGGGLRGFIPPFERIRYVWFIFNSMSNTMGMY